MRREQVVGTSCASSVLEPGKTEDACSPDGAVEEPVHRNTVEMAVLGYLHNAQPSIAYEDYVDMLAVANFCRQNEAYHWAMAKSPRYQSGTGAETRRALLVRSWGVIFWPCG